MEDSKDLISRQAAIETARDVCKRNPTMAIRVMDALQKLPVAQPERLTDDDFETIRIHLSAYKEKLGNQHRWEEAEEYQRIIDRFMAFASAQPEPEGNSIHDLEELAEKVGSATVYDAAKEERTEEHAEMHACDSIHDLEELAKKVGVATLEEARNEAKKDNPYKHDTDLISRRAAIDIINRIENMDPKAKGGITVSLALLPDLNPEPDLKGEILEAVEILKEKYEEAKKTRYINKPLEYALSETWQEFRRRNEVMR